MNEKQPKIWIPKLNGYHCFACGTANPIGLNLAFYRRGDTVCSDVTLSKNYEGWENMAHGGIISTILDEVMSWTVMILKKTFLVTRKMDIKYVKPVPIDVPLTIVGRMTDSSEFPIMKAQGEVRDQEGKLLVKGGAEFFSVSGERLSGVPERLKRDMLTLFEQMA